MGDLQERQAGTFLGYVSMGDGEDEFVAQRPQEEVGVVHRAGGEGDRLLGGLLRRGDHREETDPGSLEPLPLGKPTASQAMTYSRGLLACVLSTEGFAMDIKPIAKPSLWSSSRAQALFLRAG